MVAAAMKYLGPEREPHCELLGDVMVQAIESICASAGVKIQLTAGTAADVERLLQQLGPQIQQHAEQIAHAAVQVLVSVYITTLNVARGAPSGDDGRNAPDSQ